MYLFICDFLKRYCFGIHDHELIRYCMVGIGWEYVLDGVAGERRGKVSRDESNNKCRQPRAKSEYDDVIIPTSKKVICIVARYECIV